MNNHSYAFLSYSKKDETIARQLISSMAFRGLKIYRDVDIIEPGTHWQQALEAGLSGASVVLYLSSCHTINSKWIDAELNSCLNSGKLIIPIILDDQGLSSLPQILRAIQWLDARHGINSITDHLEKLLSQKFTRASKPIDTPEQKIKGYVFLSYAEEDDDFLQVIRPFLRDKSYAYWDFQENDRDYHVQFTFELEQIISEAVATLSILSDAWRTSKWTVREFFFSEEIKKPIFLLRAKPMRPTLAIAGIPYIDFVASTLNGIEKLDRELKRKGL